jgi:hypothetical protein
MNNSFKALLFAAAVSGLMAGTTAKASVLSPTGSSTAVSAGSMSFGGFSAHMHKHSCKGKNSCKGQGGCKSSDNGCKGKNSCKGKGGCATDGSKMPSFR